MVLRIAIRTIALLLLLVAALSATSGSETKILGFVGGASLALLMFAGAGYIKRRKPSEAKKNNHTELRVMFWFALAVAIPLFLASPSLKMAGVIAVILSLGAPLFHKKQQKPLPPPELQGLGTTLPGTKITLGNWVFLAICVLTPIMAGLFSDDWHTERLPLYLFGGVVGSWIGVLFLALLSPPKSDKTNQ